MRPSTVSFLCAKFKMSRIATLSHSAQNAGGGSGASTSAVDERPPTSASTVALYTPTASSFAVGPSGGAAPTTIPFPLPFEEPLLIPPLNFSLVAPGVYRSGYPNKKNHAFLASLGLRTILYVRQCYARNRRVASARFVSSLSLSLTCRSLFLPGLSDMFVFLTLPASSLSLPVTSAQRTTPT